MPTHAKASTRIQVVFFVNWRGGAGNNIEDDLAQEISNKLSKNIVQRMGDVLVTCQQLVL